MAGVALAVGALVVTATLALGCAAVAAAAVHSAHVSGVADAAALAAADAAIGVATGVPCERAAEVVGAAGAELIVCELHGLTATIRVRLGSGLFAADARARAGPAG